MKPFITKVDITHYSKGWLKKICSCNKKCTTGVTVTIHDEGFTMCEGEAKKTLYDLMGVLGVNHGADWTEADIQFILQHYEEKGMYKGFNNYIATTLNKTYGQAKAKTTTLKKQGHLGGVLTRKDFHVWTKEEEEILLNHYEQFGGYKGFLKDVEQKLDLTYPQIKNKIRKMREKGYLGGFDDVGWYKP